MQPSHATEYTAISSNTGKEWSLYPTPSAAPRKANTSRNGNVPCCENYNRPQRLWLPAKLFRKLIKSCFTRCVRATARHPAAHLARPASECLPGSPPRKVCRGLPPRCTPLAACLPAARGLHPDYCLQFYGLRCRVLGYWMEFLRIEFYVHSMSTTFPSTMMRYRGPGRMRVPPIQTQNW